jgi:hypothetical protein
MHCRLFLNASGLPSFFRPPPRKILTYPSHLLTETLLQTLIDGSILAPVTLDTISRLTPCKLMPHLRSLVLHPSPSSPEGAFDSQ